MGVSVGSCIVGCSRRSAGMVDARRERSFRRRTDFPMLDPAPEASTRKELPTSWNSTQEARSELEATMMEIDPFFCALVN